MLVLDISEGKGIRIAETVRKRNFGPAIIFRCDSHETDILSLMKYRPSGVIFDDELDPEGRTASAVIAICKEQLNVRTFFSLKNKGMIMCVYFDDIVYFESDRRVIKLHTRQHVTEFYARISDIEGELPSNDFVRCHQSFIVNLNAVSTLDKKERRFVLNSGESVEISKKYYTYIVGAYENFVEL